MIWYVVAIAIVLVLGVVAAMAAGRGGTMPEAFDDRVDARIPAGAVTETDVAKVRLPVAVRGYRMEEVDNLLDALGAQISAQQATIDRLRSIESTRGVYDTPEPVASEQSDEVAGPRHEPTGL